MGAQRQGGGDDGPQEIRLDYTPQPKQALLHATKARQILYGGALGGGKSHCLRMDAVIFCLQNPGLDAYLFRRNLTELEHNHIKKLTSELPAGMAHYSQKYKRLEFPNGSTLNFCYCESERDVEVYQGAEMHWIGIDEAGNFTPYQLSYLKTRNRLGSFRPERDRERLPRVVMTANPGGIAHNYLKDTFMRTAPMTEFIDEAMRDANDPDHAGWLSLFIPAKMDDNEFIDKNYGATVNHLPEWMQKALRDGDWDVVAGAFFDCWGPRNVVRPFQIPAHWTRFRACDYGHATPFWIGWFAVSDGSLQEIPEDALVVYREWYGSHGKNQGLRLPAEQIAERVKVIERGENIRYGVADPSMWRTDSGPSAAEKMARAGVVWRPADNERVLGWQELYSRIRGYESWAPGTKEAARLPGTGFVTPMLYVFDTCVALTRCIPTLQHDERDPEDVKKQGEDHAGDGCRYGVMSRPWATQPPVERKPITAPLTFAEMMRNIPDEPAMRERI